MQILLRTSLALVLGLSFAACASQKVEPLTASSADQRGYAVGYPAHLSRLRAQFTQYELQVQQILGEFTTYPSQLDAPHWPDVDQAVSLADQEGKSSAYADAFAGSHEVGQFFVEEGKTIKQKVGGAAQFAAKEKSCDVELYGPTGHALDKTIEKQLQERSEASSEAVQYIEDNAGRIGEKNTQKLKAQAAKITEASYLTRVGVRQTWRDLQAVTTETSAVKSTLEDAIESAKAIQSDATRSKEDVARAAERQKSAEAALTSLDSEVKQAEHVLTTFEERTKKLDDAYAKALEGLKDAIEAQAKAATP